MDPVALTIALWLGLMVGLAGLARLSDATSKVSLIHDGQRTSLTGSLGTADTGP